VTAPDAHEALDVVAVSKRFQMQWHDRKGGRWVPMENGAAPAVWRPRQTAVEAAAKRLTCTRPRLERRPGRGLAEFTGGSS
jgi:hypothetical protein